MALFAFAGAKKQRLKEQALYEAEVVTAVKKHLDDKISEFDDTAVELNRKLEQREREFLAKKKAGCSERELERLGMACDRMSEQIAHNDNKTDDFVRVREVILDLEMYVQSLIDYELYTYLIKVIPEKKLPAMINNENELNKVVELVLGIIDKIEKKIARSIKDKAELDAAKRKIKERAAIMKANYSSTFKAKDVDTRASELEKKYGSDNAEYTMPAPASAEANVNAANQNKA